MLAGTRPSTRAARPLNLTTIEELEKFDESGPCFTKTWNTPSKRQKLWCVCNREGREIGSLLLYGIAQITRDAMELGYEGCQLNDILYVRETIAEGHARVAFLKVDIFCTPSFLHMTLADDRYLL